MTDNEETFYKYNDNLHILLGSFVFLYFFLIITEFFFADLHDDYEFFNCENNQCTHCSVYGCI